MKTAILLCTLSLLIGLNINAKDSIIKVHELSTSKTVENPPNTKKSDKSQGYIIALIGLLGIGFGSFVTYRIAIRQTKYKLIEIKLDILKSRKEKLKSLKHEIHNRQVDISGTITEEIIKNRFIERLVQDISSMMQNSELFDIELISELKSYTERLNKYAYQTKIGKPLDNKIVAKDLEQIPVFDKRIKTEIDKKLSDIENKINLLLKE